MPHNTLNIKLNYYKEYAQKHLNFIALAILFLSIYIAHWCYKHNRYDINIELEAPPHVINMINLYKVTPHKTTSELDKTKTNEWKSSIRHVSKLWIETPQTNTNYIDEIKIKIGPTVHVFTSDQISKFKNVSNNNLMEAKEGNAILQFPDELRNCNSLLMKLLATESLNWKGDFHFLISSVLGILLTAAGIFTVIILLEFKTPILFNCVFPFILTFIITGFFSITQIDATHDGILLKPAIDVAQGKMLFRDTFTQYGALTTLFQSFAIKIFGESLVVIRLLTAFIYGAIASLNWLIFIRILSKSMCMTAYIIWLLIAYFWIDHPAMMIYPWSTTFAVFAILLSLYFLILYIERKSFLFIFLAGIATAASFWFKINYGAICFVFMFTLLLLIRFHSGTKLQIKCIIAFLVGNIAVHSVFSIWLYANGAMHDFYLQTVKLAVVFAGDNKFTTGDPFLIDLFKLLLQIGSVHGYTSFLWTVLPVVNLIGLLMLILNYLHKRQNASLQDITAMCISFMAAGLWFGYYPMNSLYHMYSSAVLFVGMLVYFCFNISKLLAPESKSTITVLLISLLVITDISTTTTNGIHKIARISNYEMIHKPRFLRGMLVNKSDKQVCEELKDLVNQYPEYDLINLTLSGLYSLFRENNKEFHKIYVDWQWYNSYLYPDYIPKLREAISEKNHVIISNNNLTIDGYIPVRVFAALNGGPLAMDFSEESILLAPGTEKNVFEISNYYKNVNVDSDSKYKFFTIKSKTEEPIKIDSIIIKVTGKNNIPEEISRHKFEYDFLPRAISGEQKDILKKAYELDKTGNTYIYKHGDDNINTEQIVLALSELYLYEKQFDIADTFENTTLNNKINVSLNGQLIKERSNGKINITINRSDVLDTECPYPGNLNQCIIKIRVNYNNNFYQENVINIF